MAFDPDAYLKKKAGEAPAGGFDPDAYLSKKKAPTGMGDLKLAESQAGPVPAAPAKPGFLESRTGRVLMAPLQFAGNVAQSLSTGPINAVAQAVQDEDGAGAVAWQATKNLGKNFANPFTTGPNPIQSTERTLERAGVPNQPQEFTERIPGFQWKQWARTYSNGLTPKDAEGVKDTDFIERPRTRSGLAANLGMAADILTPVPAAAAAKVGAGIIKGVAESKPLQKTMGGLGKAVGVVNKGAGRLSEEMSGVSEEALRMAGTKPGREALKAMAGKEKEIGDELLTHIENPDAFLPERQVVDEALEKMGGIDLGSAVQTLDGSKGSAVAGRLSPEKGAANTGIQKYIDFLRGGPVPEDLAQGAKEARRTADAAGVESAARGAVAAQDAKAAAQATRTQQATQTKAAKSAQQAGKTKGEFLSLSDEIEQSPRYGRVIRDGEVVDLRPAQRSAAIKAEDALLESRAAAARARKAAEDARAKVAVGQVTQADADAAQQAADAAQRNANVLEVADRIKRGEDIRSVAQGYAKAGMGPDELADLLARGKSRAESVRELPPQTVSAREYRALRQDLDVPINWQDEGASIKNAALKSGRTAMKNELLKMADESGNPKYAEAMRTWSDKLDKLEKIKDLLGKTGSTRDKRVEQFINNLFGKNSEYKQELMRDLDHIFKSNITEKAKAAQLASELGPTGEAGWLPRQITGRSALGYVTGAGAATVTGNPLAAAAPALFASPKIASRLTLPVLTKLEGALKANQIKLSPKATQALAALRLPLKETEKARMAQILAAELETQPANAVPFRRKAADNEDQEDREPTLSLRDFVRRPTRPDSLLSQLTRGSR